MWKWSFKKRKYALLASLIGGTLIGGTSFAANLAVTVPSNYSNSQLGIVTGSRVTTHVDDKAVANALDDLNGDPATFSVDRNGKVGVYMRQYTYSTTDLMAARFLDTSKSGTVTMTGEGNVASVPNAHAVAGYKDMIFLTGYDLGNIGVAKITDGSIKELGGKTISLKDDIINKTGAEDAAGYTDATTVHGEGLLIHDGYLYVAASVNLEGGWDNYDYGYLLRYAIGDDGTLTYKDYARIGKNTDVAQINLYNDRILVPAIGGYQNYGEGNSDTSLDVIRMGDASDKYRLNEAAHTQAKVPEAVREEGKDFRGLKVLPNGTAYVLMYNLSGGGGGFDGKVYKTTVSNLLSDTPDDWEVVKDSSLDGSEGKIGANWFARIDADYYTKRLWLEWGDAVQVYEDGATDPSHSWEATDFSTNLQYYVFNSVTFVPSDTLAGDLDSLANHTDAPTNDNTALQAGTQTTAITEKTTFTKNTVINLGSSTEGDHETNVAAAIFAKDNSFVVAAEKSGKGKTLTLQSTNTVASPVGIYAGKGNTLTVNAGTVNVITTGYEGGNSLTNAIWCDADLDEGTAININSDVNIYMNGGNGGNGIAVQKTDRWGEASDAANAESGILISGNVKIAGADTDTWGISANKENVLSRFNNAGILTSVKNSYVTVTGNADMTVYGNGITTNAEGSTVSVGGGHIVVPAGRNYGYYTLAAYQGTINMNMTEDEDDESLLAPDENDVQLDGDIFVLPTGTVNVALTTEDSYLDGIVDNGGTADLWLANGATWTNRARNARYSTDDEDVGSGEATRVTSFTGGASADTAGNIFQKDDGALTIDSYSGYTNIFYEHTNDGDEASDYAAGDIVISSAKTGSAVSLITDNTGITMSDDDAVAKVLSALAGKLIYSAYATGEKNLTGSVKIAEGLTSASAVQKTGSISFIGATGQGYVGDTEPEPTAPDHQIKKDFTTSLTGVRDTDTEYFLGGVIQDAGYVFTEDSTITVDEEDKTSDNVGSYPASAGILVRTNDTTVDASGKTLTISASAEKSTYPKTQAIGIYTDKALTVKADTLNVNASSTGGDAVGIKVMNGGSAAITGNVNVNVSHGGDGTAYGINLYQKGSSLTIDGDLDMTGKDGAAYGVMTSSRGGYGTQTYQAKGIYLYDTTGATLNVTGKADISVRGDGIHIAGSDKNTVNISSGSILTPESSADEFNAINAARGTLNMGMTEDGSAANGKDVTIQGQIYAIYGKVNLGFGTENSSFTGNVYLDPDDSGEVNLWLANGAAWNNRTLSSVSSLYEGSYVTKLTGGASKAAAGNIFQKDTKALTIGSYSGYTNLFYAHTNDGDEASDYAAGDTIIKKAAEGSVVNVITDNTGITMSDETAVAKTLNALAGKLTYSEYVSGTKNLTGYVKIAEGLTASSAAKKTGDITFDSKTGKGTYVYDDPTPGPTYPESQDKTAFTTAITGVRASDTEYLEHGVLSSTEDNNIYNFTKDATTITTSGSSITTAKDTTVKLNGNDLTVTANGGSAIATTGGKLTVSNGKVLTLNGGVKATNSEVSLDAATLVVDGNVEADGSSAKVTAAFKGASAKLTGNAATANNGVLYLTFEDSAEWTGDNTGSAKITMNKGIWSGANTGDGAVINATDSTWSGANSGANAEIGLSGGTWSGVNSGAGSKITLTNSASWTTNNTADDVTVDMTGSSWSGSNNGANAEIGLDGGTWSGANKGAGSKITLKNGARWTAGNTADDVTITLDKSSWTGSTSGSGSASLANGSTWEGASSSALFALTLSGSTWTNTGESSLKSLTGGASESAIGNIFQKDTNALNIANYSGYTNIFYVHTNDGDEASDYAAGDTIISKAAAGSVVNVITDNTGITMSDEAAVAKTLNALAGKLTYSEYVSGTKNLTGYVKIAEGLTASSAALKTGDITFEEATGKGTYAYEAPKPDPEPKTAFTTTIAGANETEYTEAGIIQSDGTYKFTQDSSITVSESESFTADAVRASGNTVTVDAEGKELTMTVSTEAVANGISAMDGGSAVLTADKLILGVTGTSYETKGINAQAATVKITGDVSGTVEGATGEYDVSYGIYAGRSYSSDGAGSVTISGKTELAVTGKIAVAADSLDSSVTLDGGRISITEGSENATYALAAGYGQISVNMNADKTAAKDNDLVIIGNVGVGAKLIDQYSAMAGSKATAIDIGLATAASSLTGIIYNAFDNEAAANEYDKGYVNLWLANGASWTNESYGVEPEGFAGSSVSKLTGGASESTAGNIFQKDANALNIANYSGYTNIFYVHTNDGDEASDYAAGDTIISKAAAGSVVNVITDNTGITMSDEAAVAKTLNALAGKLTYSEYVNGTKNLTGYVKIAEGLTASSAALQTGDITFEDATGKGTYAYEAPKPKTEFTTTIAGNNETEYTEAGIIQTDGTYKFTEDSTVTVSASTGSRYTVNASSYSDVTVDAAGKQLTLAVKAKTAYGVNAEKQKKAKITADKVIVSAEATTAAAVGVRAAGATAEIDGDLTVTAKGNAASSYGLLAMNNSSNAGTVTVNGDADITMTGGSGIVAKSYDSGVTVSGGGSISVDQASSKAVYAAAASNGQISLNMNADKTAAEGNDLVIKGNIAVGGTGTILGSTTNGKKATEIDIGLATAESSLTGIIYNAFSNAAADEYNKGYVNLWLANGATWTNASYGTAPTGFAGSRVSKLTGGTSAAAAGNIFQNDTNALTVDSYSGYANIFYAHTNDGDEASDYAAGDTIISAAAAGSVVNVITDNTGITMSDEAAVAKTLNALAGKLTYSEYVNGTKNLTGYVKIAEGLTASSAALKTGDITFEETTGKGTYVYEEPKSTSPITETTTLTYDRTAIGNEKNAPGSGSAMHSSALYVGDNETASKAKPMVVDMNGYDLTLEAKGASSIASAIDISGNQYVEIKNTEGKTLTLKATNTDDTRAANGIFVGGNYAHLTIDSDVIIDELYTKGDSVTGINIQGAGSTSGSESDVTINGDLTIRNVTAVRGRGKGVNAAGIKTVADGSKVIVNGNVDIEGLAGSGLYTVGTDSEITVGGGTITAAEDADHSKQYFAARADKGTININVKDDTAGSAVTKLTGDLYVTRQYGQKTVEYSGGTLTDFDYKGVLNVALTTADSFWTGANTYTVSKSDYASGGYTAYDVGTFNLWLQNGATWTNEVRSSTSDALATFAGSHVAKLTGGAAAAAAGNIFQNDSRSITIDSYSGWTNIFYDHENDGDEASDYAAGDTIITAAAAGSGVSLITDSDGITLSDKASVGNALNTLAGKLTYSAYVNGEKNLTGYVKIAEGLTAASASAALQTGDITFDAVTGKGTYVFSIYPDHQTETEFTEMIWENNEEIYRQAGVYQADEDVYRFTEDSTVTVVAKSGMKQGVRSYDKAITIDAAGKDLTLTVSSDRGDAYGINADGNNPVSAKADKLIIDAASTQKSAYGIKNAGTVVTIDGDVAATVSGKSSSYGILAYGSAGTDGRGAGVTINGKADIEVTGGNGIVANRYDSAVTVTGGGSVKVDKTSKTAVYAALASNGQISLNMNADKTAAAENDLVIAGNVGIAPASNYLGTKVTEIDLGLATKDSAFTGIIYSTFDNANAANEYDKGYVNLWLANGATWTNESYGIAPTGFAGSSVSKLTGGTSAEKAGNIFQKDTNALTVDSYSGWTNIYYDHENDGSAASDYAAGDTIIKSAAAGSGVNLITDSEGIDLTDEFSVKDALNALANKLYYTGYIGQAEKNLTGYVKIAEGLTASSAAKQTGSIVYSETTGQGSLDASTVTPGITYPESQTQDTYSAAITGDERTDKLYKQTGVLKDGIYTFTKDPTAVTVTDDAAVDTVKDVTVKSTDAALTLTGKAEGIHAAAGTTVDITAKKLTTNGIRSEGTVKIAGETNVTGGITAAEGGSVTLKDTATVAGDISAAGTVELSGKSNITGNVSAAEGGSVKVKDAAAVKGNISSAGTVEVDSAETVTGNISTEGSGTVKVSGADTITGDISAAGGDIDVTVKDFTGTVNASGTGNVDLTLSGTWTNTGAGSISRLTSKSGVIDMTNASAGNISVADYSGSSTVLYGHTIAADGTVTIGGGTFTIGKAQTGSSITIKTDSTGVAFNDEYSINSVLDALAKQLYYSAYTTGETNLTGYVVIGEGLTAGSVAKQTGSVIYDKTTGQGSLDTSSVKPGAEYPSSQTTAEFTSPITGDGKTDLIYKQTGVLKDGTYTFTTDPTKITTTDGAAIDAAKDVTVKSTDAALTLTGKAEGIHAAEGTTVDITAKSLDTNGIRSEGTVNISGPAAVGGDITAAEGSSVTLKDTASVTGNISSAGAVTLDGTSTIKGDVATSGSGTVKIGDADAINGNISAEGGDIDATVKDFTGTANGSDTGAANITIKEGGTWTNTGASSVGSLTSNGGTIDMTGDTAGSLSAGIYSGSSTVLYKHTVGDDGSVTINGGDVTIGKAETGSKITLKTDSDSLDMSTDASIEAVLDSMAKKLYYTGYTAGEKNLTGYVVIAEGLTASSAAKQTGNISYDATTGQGGYAAGSLTPGAVKDPEIIYGPSETAMMRGAKNAMTTSMLAWRSNSSDMMTRVGDLRLGAEDGIWARTYGGKTKYEKGTTKSNSSFWGAQVGADKLLASGWHIGGALDYVDGSASYELSGKGDPKLYTLSVYGTKMYDDGQYLDIVAKVGRTENDYTVYNDMGHRLDGDYDATGYGLSVEYGKRFGSEKGYIEPQVQLTLSRLGSADYDAVSDFSGGKKMHVSQDGMTSFIGRLGVAAGKSTENGNFYLRASLLHEFAGDTTSTFSAENEPTGSVDQDFGDTWAELTIGGNYRLSPATLLYADLTKSFGGDYEVEWKANIGLRFSF